MPESDAGRMSLVTCAVLMAMGLGGPIGFVVLICLGVQPRPPAAVDDGMTVMHQPVLSPTHWNMAIVTRAHGDGGTYAANYATANDADEEDESKRIFRHYPVGCEIAKSHYADLAAARDGGALVFITRMVRTATGHGPADDPWIYERVGANGQPTLSGFADHPAVRTQCSACHENARARDFIFTTHYQAR